MTPGLQAADVGGVVQRVLEAMVLPMLHPTMAGIS
jgi:hypothetical protein